MIFRWASTHLKDELDHCALAVSCIHDGVPVYGIAPDNRTARLFLDTCDAHEYNCDHKTSYRPCIEHPDTGKSNCAVRVDESEEYTRLSKLLLGIRKSSKSPNKTSKKNVKHDRKKQRGILELSNKKRRLRKG
ncbi:uncharacterized protein LOC125232701 isoform X2 [Leguminivora glycinivorella]|nr:uncharacterized protein LOC125232701 isoform X2 [Leguminivora glycinivorella]